MAAINEMLPSQRRGVTLLLVGYVLFTLALVACLLLA